MNDATNSEIRTQVDQSHIFRKWLPLRVTLHEIVRALGDVEGQTCLDIGSPNGMLSHLLRRHGGKWESVAVDAESAQALRSVIGEEVHVMDGDRLPFKKKAVDVVVVIDFLERCRSDDTFIEECHRVLKPDGRLIVIARHTKKAPILSPLRTVCGLSPENIGLVRAGYTESELFSVLKNGFNVLHARTYSRFFVQLVDLFVQVSLRRRRAAGADSTSLRRLFSIAGPFYRIADQLDLLFFFTRGYYLIAAAKRRAWRPRDAPILVDGRSISEAVLSRPGG